MKISEDERVIDGMKTTTLLENAIHIGSTGNDENELLKNQNLTQLLLIN